MDGKPNRGNNYNATDRNTATAVRVGTASVSYFDLASTANISRYYLNGAASGNGGLFMRMYDSAGTLLYSHRPSSSTSVNTYVDVSIENVAYVGVYCSSTNYCDVREMDVWGTYDYPIPTAFTAESDTRSVMLAWQDFPMSGFRYYEIYMDGLPAGTTTDKFFRVSNLQPDVTHDFYVIGVYDLGISKSSETVSRAAFGDPIAKPVLEAVPYEDRIQLSWNPVESINYTLYAGSVVLYQGSNLSFTHTGLKLNTTYVYLLEARDKWGRVVKSDLLEVKTREPPPPISPVVEAVKITHNSIAIKWTSLEAPYEVWFGGEKYSANGTSLLFENLTPLTDYPVRVGYTDAYNRYVESTEVIFKTIDLPAPVYPVLKASSVTETSVRLSWTAVGSSYKVYQDGILIAQPKANFHQLYNLTGETTYSFQVFAVDEFGRENPSNILDVTTADIPEPTPPPSPPQPPPDVSDTGNEDLDNANDHLVDGANKTKLSAMTIIFLVIGILIVVFGAMWLMQVFKKKMTKARTYKTKGNGARSGGAARRSGSTQSKPVAMSSISVRSTSNYKTNFTGHRPTGRKKYYVEKSYRKSR